MKRFVLLFSLLAVCMAAQPYSVFFTKMYEELGSNTAGDVASKLGSEFAVLDAGSGHLADYLYDMLDIRRADLLTSLKHIENLGVTIDLLVDFND